MKISDISDALWQLGIVTVEQKSTGTLIDGRSCWEFRVWIEERPKPPSLGISVSDGIGTEDKFGGA